MKRWILLFAAIACLAAGTACGKKATAKKKTETRITIQTSPDKATVLIDGKKVGKSPLGGEYSSGSYVVKAEKEGYFPAWKGVVVKEGETTKVEMSLKPIVTSVLLETSPSVKADVTFNGKVIGQTPVVIRDLDCGSYTARLSAPGYFPKEISWDVKDERPQKIIAEMRKNTGNITITRCVNGATVKVNGKNCGVLPYTFTAEQGDYNIEVTAPGYSTFRQKVSLISGRREIVKPRLAILPGALYITSKPAGAHIRIDGKAYGQTPNKIEGLTPNRTVRIVLTKRDYDPVSFQATVQPGKTINLGRNLSSSLGGIEFVTRPAGVTVYLHNKRLTVTEKDPNSPGYSKVFRVNSLPPGEYTLRFTHKRAKPEFETRKVTVQKNKNVRVENVVEMWVPNARITLKSTGAVYEGRIVRENKNSITLEHNRKSRINYTRKELEKIDRLAEEE